MRLSSPNDGGDASLGDIGPRSHPGPDRHRLLADNWRRFLLACLALAAWSGTALAQTYTATAGMPVRVELVGQCTVNATDLNFGTYASLAPGSVYGQAAIELSCPSGTTAEVSLDAGINARGNSTRRRSMREPDGDQLDYDLFQDSARNIHWGDNRSGRDALEVVTTGPSMSIPVYGAIPGRQKVRDGSYSDIITVTVAY
jgi:spore coat protein U-like protein